MALFLGAISNHNKLIQSLGIGFQFNVNNGSSINGYFL
ncbi:hypothetical protein BH24BAC1_BH24BAC1_08360 [soil metagenome]